VGTRKVAKVSMHFEESVMGNVDLAIGALPSQRYIASNRFKVRNGAGVSFYCNLEMFTYFYTFISSPNLKNAGLIERADLHS